MKLLDPRVWPWWGWMIAFILVLVAVLGAIVITLRAKGQAELQRVLAELKSKDLIYLPAQFTALAPTVDDARQQRAWDQQQRIKDQKWAANSLVSGSLDRLRLAPKAVSLQQSADDSQAERTAWRALVAEGPVVLTSFGWLRHDFPHPEEVGFSTAGTLRMPNLLSTRDLAYGLAAAALLAKDPHPELADLDALVAALQPGGTLIDGMILNAIAGIRDQAWLEATIRGVDPAPWIARRPSITDAIITGFSAERAWWLGSLYQDSTRGRRLDVGPLLAATGNAAASGIGGWVGNQLWWVVAPSDLAFAFDAEGRIERRLRGQPVDLNALFVEMNTSRALHPVSALMIPDLAECAITAIVGDVTAQRLRIAGALVHDWQQTHTLPADAAGVRALLPSDLLSAYGEHPAIRYTVVVPGRFRLWTDPATPASDLLPAGRIPTPAPTTAAFSDGHWWLELDLNQLPPP